MLSNRADHLTLHNWSYIFIKSWEKLIDSTWIFTMRAMSTTLGTTRKRANETHRERERDTKENEKKLPTMWNIKPQTTTPSAKMPDHYNIENILPVATCINCYARSAHKHQIYYFNERRKRRQRQHLRWL